MRDLSLHILDVVENSIRAHATRVEILIEVDEASDLLRLRIVDNGDGMDASLRAAAVDPFVTTKAGRRIGLGLPLLAQAAREADGTFELVSEPGQGTRVFATFRCSHPDCRPIGDVAETLGILIAGHPGIEFRYEQKAGDRIDVFDTREVGCR